MTRIAAPLLLALLVAAAYGGSLANDFVFDDAIFVERDPRVRSLDQTHRLFVEPLWGFNDRPGHTHVHQYYRPLQTLPLALNLAAVGEHAWPSHLLNLVVHTLNAMLVMALLVRLGADRGAALACAAVFATHPGWSESILWISDIAGLGAALALLVILRIHASATRTSPAAFFTVAAAFLAGLWFKEVAIVAPVLMLAFDTLARVNPRDAPWGLYAATAVALLLYLPMRVAALGGLVPGLGHSGLGLGPLLANALVLIPDFLSALVWPFDLNMYHDFEIAGGLGDSRLWAGLAAATALSLGLWRRRTVVSPAAFACAWIVVTMAPYLLVRWPKLNVFAERYTYLPAIGVLALCALAATRLVRAKPQLRTPAAVLTAALVLIFVAADRARTGEWRNEVTIYEHTLAKTERGELIRNNLGLRYLELGRLDDAREQLLRVISIDASFADAHHNLGLVQLAKGNVAAAADAFERARALAPGKPETLLNLGYAYDAAGLREKAVATYRRLTTLDPGHSAAWYNLAIVASEARQTGHARAAISRVLAADPNDAAALALRDALAERNPALSPNDPRTEERCRRAKGLIDAGEVAEAEELLLAAAWLDERAALPHHFLANLYYLSGRPQLALEQMRLAETRAPDTGLYRRNREELEKSLSQSDNTEAP